MSKQKDDLLNNSKTREDELIDAILGGDEEMDDELAAAILAEYEIDESELVEDFKQILQADLRKIPPTGTEADNLRMAIRSITEHQKATSPEDDEPDDFFANLFGGFQASLRRPTYAFQNRKEGEMPDQDKKILDDLEKELLDEGEQ